jgi:hypothetical protein
LRKAWRNRKHQAGRGDRHPDQVPKLDHAKLSSLARLRLCITVWQISKTI